MYKFFISLILIVQFYSISYSCTCGSKPSIKDSWETASQVFVGEVISMDTSDNIYSSYGSKVQLYTVRVLESYKYGFNTENNIRTFTNTGGGSCDRNFEVGKTYLIYADTRHFATFLSASECSRTDLLQNISEKEIEKLEELHEEWKDSKNKSSHLLSKQEIDRDNGLLIATNDRLNKENRIIIIISSIVIVILLTSLIILWRKKFVK